MMKIVGQHRSCIERQANEAVRISRSEADMILNSKSEWHQAPLIRIIPVSGMLEDQVWLRRRTTGNSE